MLPGWSLEAVGNGGPRGMALTFASASGRRHRTRLTVPSDPHTSSAGLGNAWIFVGAQGRERPCASGLAAGFVGCVHEYAALLPPRPRVPQPQRSPCEGV